MAAPVDRPGEPSSERPSSETSTRRLREQSQLDFEIEFLGRLLERDPYFADALRVQANNLAAIGQYGRALQLDRRLVRLMPEDAIAWYNLACSYTVLGMIDPGFFALQRALELGYRWAIRLRRDPDLKALRRDPRFARLLRRFGFRA
jgi:tetratricopeptide (TPR) repeat protein